jgi:hypothetical protein
VKNRKVKRRLSGLRWRLYNNVDTYIRMIEKDCREIDIAEAPKAGWRK